MRDWHIIEKETDKISITDVFLFKILITRVNDWYFKKDFFLLCLFIFFKNQDWMCSILSEKKSKVPSVKNNPEHKDNRIKNEEINATKGFTESDECKSSNNGNISKVNGTKLRTQKMIIRFFDSFLINLEDSMFTSIVKFISFLEPVMEFNAEFEEIKLIPIPIGSVSKT